jgi:MarR family transcriptional regulator, temperature-dependent positive regulator of motility
MVTTRQYDVLAAAAASPGVSQHKLMLATGIDRSTLADIVRRLCRTGLLTRRRTREDARAYAVTLTSEGEIMLAQMAVLSRQVDKEIAKPLSASEQATLRALLERMATAEQ